MLDSIISAIGDIYLDCTAIQKMILAFLGIFTFHNGFYGVLSFFCTRKFKPAKNQHKYAVLIPARNEEMVIGNLLDSIKKQDYPQKLITVFVVADNCTDHTAQIARERGAICYERFNDAERTKGFALKFLLERIQEDYGIESFEGYFIFDSDNLLNRDYISRMNDAFDEGEKIITSYRNTKNFDENWVASTYALHWIRSIRLRHRARSVLRLATNLQGTGFLFANELVKDGWKYTSLTEDRAFTADAVAHGYQITYNDAAMFYDEQPTKLWVVWRQRLRWSKGHLQAFKETGGMLTKNICLGKRNKTPEEKKFTFRNLLEEIRYRWMSFDTLAQMFPAVVIRMGLWLLISVFMYGCYCYGTGLQQMPVFEDAGKLGGILSYLFGELYVEASPGVQALFYGMALATFWRVAKRLVSDCTNMLSAVYIFIIERKRIKKIPVHKKILYCITWPTFDMFYRYSMYAALFVKVTWKPIPHTSQVKIEDIE